MKEIAIISGKGGTGKTSITAALTDLEKNCAFVDCDVDASNLHLIKKPEIKEKLPFVQGLEFQINKDLCTGCNKCVKLCRFDAISEDFVIDKISCEKCGVCAFFCPEQAIESKDNECGEIFISETEQGPFIFSKLGIGEGNSGKLVDRIRKDIKNLAEEANVEKIYIDGSPGTGCPVIASITGTQLVVIITEPNLSAMHDLERAVELTAHFRIKTLVCINKADINPDVAGRIKEFCNARNIQVAGEIGYDPDFIEAQKAGKSIISFSDGPAVQAVKELHKAIQEAL